MVGAYILIQTHVGRSAEVAAAAAQVPGVIASDDVIGPYDVIVQAEAADVDELGRMVVSQLQAIDGIDRTLTCTIVRLH